MGKEKLQSRTFAEKLLVGGSQVLHFCKVPKIGILDEIEKVLLLDEVPVRFQHIACFQAEVPQRI